MGYGLRDVEAELSLLELLQAGDVDGFNAARASGDPVDLFAADLCEARLGGVDWSQLKLDKSDLTEADLTGANLMAASLSGIDGSGMKLSSVMALKIRMKEAWCDEADLTGGDFSRGNFSETNFEGSTGDGVVFTGARLKRVNASRCRWNDADLVEANVHAINLTEADLRRSDLSDASGGEIVAVGAKLDGALALHSKFPGIDLSQASLVGARLLGANLQGAKFVNADLTNADLSGSDLTGADFTGATLTGVVLADVCLDEVSLDGLDLTGADLTGLDPAPLGLNAAQRKQVMAVGVQVPEDAPLKAYGVQAAFGNGRTLVVWENVDGEEARSLRVAVIDGKKVGRAVLQVAAEKVLGREVSEDRDGFSVVLLQERPGGVGMVRYRFGAKAEVLDATSGRLGYEPMVVPILSYRDERLIMWGLARQGPTLAIHRDGAEGLAVGGSKRIPTATGFLGSHHPVLACKGDVIQVAGSRDAGSPRRTPEGFPGRIGLAAPVQDRILCVWVAERVGDRAGGLRTGWLLKRGGPDLDSLGKNDSVSSLDLLGDDDGAWLAWVEIDGDGRGAVHRCRLEPEAGLGEAERLVPNVDGEHVVIAGVDKHGPVLMVTTEQRGLVRVDGKGKPLAL